MRKGSKHTLETKLKMRGHKRSKKFCKRLSEIAKLQERKPPSQSGAIPWNKGKIGLQIAWNKGIPMAKNSREKLRISINNLYSQHPEIKQKISEAITKCWQNNNYRKRCEEAQKGEKATLWKGGIQFEPYSPEFSREYRKSIRKRDGYRCRLCGKLGKSVHHIDYNKKNSNSLNLVTLCFRCHSKTNHNRKYWIKKLTVAETK
jgi:hypothetical protein